MNLHIARQLPGAVLLAGSYGSCVAQPQQQPAEQERSRGPGGEYADLSRG